MPITIKYEKCWVGDVKSVKILEIEALGAKDLPKKYYEFDTEYVKYRHTNGESYLDQWTGPVYFSDEDNTEGICRTGATAPADWFFKEYIPFLKRCGERLAKIREEEKRKAWSGEDEIKI